MTNAARDLLVTFQDWKEATREHGRPDVARGWAGGEDLTDEHLVAIRNLIEVRRTLDELKADGRAVDHYFKYVTRWLHMLVNYQHSWSQPVDPEAAFPQGDLDSLNGLAALLDFTPLRELQPEGRRRLDDALNEARTLLLEDDSISSVLRFYLAAMIREMQAALDDEELGATFDFTTAAGRLWVGMKAAAGESKTKKRAWGSAAKDLLIAPTAGVLTHAGTVAFDQVSNALGTLN